jgi:hypothetical protein
MFIKSDHKGQVEDNTFYSQRGQGPVYRWHYEARLARWQGVRLHTSQWSSHEMCNASWHSVPQELKVQLGEHYVE